MNTELFSLREQEIFNILKQLKNNDFVIIGGYAVNAYTLPRFSVDCDIVIKEHELKQIEKVLSNNGYIKEEQNADVPYSGSFSRHEKKLENNFSVNLDILINAVTDRATGATFNAEWVFKNSKKNILKGKTITEELQVRIIDIDALIVMKIISCRSTDIRDVFMMFPYIKNKEGVRSEVSARCDFTDRMKRLTEKVTSKQFKDGLSGVYGYFDEKVFEKHKKALLSFKGEL